MQCNYRPTDECHLFDAAKCQEIKSKERTHKTIIFLVYLSLPASSIIRSKIIRTAKGRLLISSHPSSRCLLLLGQHALLADGWHVHQKLDSPVPLSCVAEERTGDAWIAMSSQWIYKNHLVCIVVMKPSGRRMTKQIQRHFIIIMIVLPVEQQDDKSQCIRFVCTSTTHVGGILILAMMETHFGRLLQEPIWAQ